MNIGGIGNAGYPAVYGVEKRNKNVLGKKVENRDNFSWSSAKRALMEEEEERTASRQESKTKSDIIVKADGSRVLVITTDIAGMETAMSLEISKPTEAPNENEKEHGGNREKSLKERESNRRIGGSIGMAEED